VFAGARGAGITEAETSNKEKVNNNMNTTTKTTTAAAAAAAAKQPARFSVEFAWQMNVPL